MPQTYNEKLEISILHCLFKDGSLYPIIEDIIEKKSFGWPSFGLIYQSIADIVNSDLYPDPMSVYVDLDRKGKLDEIRIMSNGLSGKEALDFIENFQEADSNNIESYAYALQEIQATRQLIKYKEKLGDMIENSKRPYEILSWSDLETGKIATFMGVKSKNVKDANDVAKESFGQFEEAINGDSRYISTGIKAWDDFTGGIFPERLYIVAAYSNDGKSALVHNLLYNISIKQKIKGMIISLEMSATEVNNRLIQMQTGISPIRIEKGEIKQTEIELYKTALNNIKDAPIIYDDSSEIILALLRTKIRKAVASGCKYIIIDQLEQILLNGINDTQAEHIKLNYISYRIKSFARELGVAIILVHQMNRSAENGQNRGKNVEPQLSDLSQASERAADAVLMIRHKKENQKILESYFWWVKNRQGQKGRRRINFDGSHVLFSDIDGLSEWDVPDFVQDDFMTNN